MANYTLEEKDSFIVLGIGTELKERLHRLMLA